MVISTSNTHHTFWDKISFVMVTVIFRASVREPFTKCCMVLGDLSAFFVFCTFQGQRVTAAARVRGP